eukprot:Tamp_34116.p1 GENE.Tamp_34116~~Tamp_34116.p1  ORF type:complete len:104 (+),score=3.65 Tamp_34116:111-422(+)
MLMYICRCTCTKRSLNCITYAYSCISAEMHPYTCALTELHGAHIFCLAHFLLVYPRVTRSRSAESWSTAFAVNKLSCPPPPSSWIIQRSTFSSSSSSSSFSVE